MVSLSPPVNPPVLKGVKVYADNPFKFDFILDKGDEGVIASEAKQSLTDGHPEAKPKDHKEPKDPSVASLPQDDELRSEAHRLIKYFLASITVPEDDLWVNLSPYEKDRIIPDAFGKTEMGRDLLAQDYLLKQVTASLIYPEEKIGKEFWQKVYAQAAKQFGTTNIPVNTFNKVWIVPEKAVVYENGSSVSFPNASVPSYRALPKVIGDPKKNNQSVAYVVEARLKVMLEQDYLAMDKAMLTQGHVPSVIARPEGPKQSDQKIASLRPSDSARNDTSALGSQIVRDIVLPQLEREVNEGKNFIQLRQVYNSLILAAWYKQKIKQSILAKIYADKNKVTGVGYQKSVIPLSLRGRSEATDEAILTRTSNDQKIASPPSADRNDDVGEIYNQYIAAFKKGVFNYIKEEPSPSVSLRGIAEGDDEAISKETTIPRKYFSGGVSLAMTSNNATNLRTDSAMRIVTTMDAAQLPQDADMLLMGVNVDPAPEGFPDAAMFSEEKEPEGIVMDAQDTPTPRVPFQHNNKFLNFLVKATEGKVTGRTVQQYQDELDQQIFIAHARMLRDYGFLHASSQDPQATIIQQIFIDLKKGFESYARSVGEKPNDQRKLFIVDSPQVNAFVFAQREDVYVNVGYFRELANYCKLNKIALTKSVLAAALTHELGHILQRSTFEGISFAIIQEEALKSELLDLKRNAEHEADSASRLILRDSGYDPQAMEIVIKFLEQIEPRVAAEVAVEDHPHPSQRLQELQKSYQDESTVLEREFEQPEEVRYMEEQGQGERFLDLFLNWNGKRLGEKATEIHSYDDIVKGLNEATTIEEVVELARIAKYLKQRIPYLKATGNESVRRAFAREIYRNNVIDFMNMLVEGELQVKGYPPTGFYTKEQGRDPNEREALFLGRLLSHENLDNIPTEGVLGARGLIPVVHDQPNYENNISNLERHYYELRNRIYHQLDTVPIERRLRLIEYIDRMFARAKEKLKSDFSTPEALDKYERSSKSAADPKGVLDSLRQGKIEAMDALQEVPFCFYQNYGLSSLSKEEEIGAVMGRYGANFLRRGGIRPDELELGKVHFERRTSGFYSPNVHLLPVDTPQQRRKVFEVLMLGMLGRDQENLLPASTRMIDHLENAVKSVVTEFPQNWSQIKRNQFHLWMVKQLLGESYDYDTDFIRFYRQIIPKFDTDIFSGIFDQELSGNVYIERSGANNGSQNSGVVSLDRPIDFEINNDLSGVAHKIWEKHRLLKGDTLIVALRQELKGYSIRFRKGLIERLFSHKSGFFHFYPRDLKKLMEGLIAGADQFDVLLDEVSSYDNKAVESWDDATFRDVLSTMKWLIDHKPGTIPEFKEEFAFSYLKVRMAWLRRQPASRGALSPPISLETAWDILNDLSRAITIEITHPSKGARTELRINHLAIGQVGTVTWDELLKEQSARLGEVSVRPIPSAELPLSIFHVLRSILDEDGMMEQELVRRVFDLDLDRLQAIARNQQKIRDDRSPRRGRFKQMVPSNSFHQLLNSLIIVRVLHRQGFNRVQVNSTDFAPLFSGRLSGWTDTTHQLNVDFKISMVNLVEQPQSAGDGKPKEGEDVFSWIKQTIDFSDTSDKNYARALAFFRTLGQGLVDKNSSLDDLLEEISKTPLGLRLFPEYAALFQDNPIDVQPVHQNSGVRRGYVEAFLEGASFEGTKAGVFRRYDSRFSRLTASRLPLEERLKSLSQFMTVSSLFRDGFLETWERALVPEMDFSWGLGVLKYAYRQKKRNRLKDEYEKFELMGLTVPLQWERIQKDDQRVKNGGKSVFKLSSARAAEVLGFYEQVISLVGDPQRQMRMGSVAIRVFRQAYPQASFAKEVEAIRKFFPVPSRVRDEHIHDLMDRHVLPSPETGVEELNEAQKMFSAHSFMAYDQEVNNAHFAVQIVKAVLALASRQDRQEILLWMISPKEYPKPRLIDQIEDKFNVIFDDLPQHATFVPQSVRDEILEGVFLGENGLFNPVTDNDQKVLADLWDKLFLGFFPLPGKKEGNGRMSPKMHQLVREIFPIIMQKYSVSRRAHIVIAMLRNYHQLEEMSDGDKLSVLLAAMGPVGVKNGQMLSENDTIIPNEALRKSLGKLKNQATPIKKTAVLEIVRMALEEAGIPFEHVRVGRMLGAASMKQVHEGWILQEGTWKHVVIKAIRPKIARVLQEDMDVLDAVLAFLKKEKGFDLGHIHETVHSWINTERNLNLERGNMNEMEVIVEEYHDQVLEPGQELIKWQVPKVIVSGNSSVMMEEMAPAVGLGALFKPTGLRGWMRGEGFKTRRSVLMSSLKSKGMDEGAAKALTEKILAMGEKKIVTQLRQLLLYMVFEKGVFQADMHSDNVMLGSDFGHLIDLGLIGKFSFKQIQGARDLFKGLLLHDTALLLKGVKGIHVHSLDVPEQDKDSVATAIDAESGSMEKELDNIFAKGQQIKMQMNDILKLVSQKRFKGNRDFSNYMKALITAIWLFPMDIFSAQGVLDDLSKALVLSPQEKERVKKVHAVAAVKHSLALAVQNWTGDARALSGRGMAPLARTVRKAQDGIKRLRRVGMMMKNVTRVRAALGGLSSIELKEERDKSLQETDGHILSDVQMWAIDDPVATYDMSRTKPIVIDMNIVDKVAAGWKLDGLQKARFIETLNLYVRFTGRIGMKDLGIGLSNFEKDVLESAGIGLNDLLGRIFAMRSMRTKYQGGFPENFLLPANASLRYLGERLADLCLSDLGSHRDDFINLKSEIKADEFTFHLSVPKQISVDSYFVRHTAGLISRVPEHLRSFRIRDRVLSMTKNLKPNRWEKYEDKKAFRTIRVWRSGYKENAYYRVLISDLAGNQFLKFRLSEEALQKFILSGEVSGGYLERWQAVTYDSPQELKGHFEIVTDTVHLMSDGSHDQAMLGNKGGIDLTTGKLPLQVKMDSRFSAKGGSASGGRGNDSGKYWNDNGDNEVLFNIDPAMLKRYQEAPGLVPVIIRMEPMKDLPLFLGLDAGFKGTGTNS